MGVGVTLIGLNVLFDDGESGDVQRGLQGIDECKVGRIVEWDAVTEASSGCWMFCNKKPEVIHPAGRGIIREITGKDAIRKAVEQKCNVETICNSGRNGDTKMKRMETLTRIKRQSCENQEGRAVTWKGPFRPFDQYAGAIPDGGTSMVRKGTPKGCNIKYESVLARIPAN